MVRIFSIVAGAALVAAAVAEHSVGADFSSLVRRVPADANAVVLIDSGRLLDSPIAVRGGWKKKYMADYATPEDLAAIWNVEITQRDALIRLDRGLGCPPIFSAGGLHKGLEPFLADHRFL